MVTALNESDTVVSARYFIARWSRGLGRLVFIQKDIGSNPIRVTLITKGQVVVGGGNLNEDNEMMVKLLPGRFFSMYTSTDQGVHQLSNPRADHSGGWEVRNSRIGCGVLAHAARRYLASKARDNRAEDQGSSPFESTLNLFLI